MLYLRKQNRSDMHTKSNEQRNLIKWIYTQARMNPYKARLSEQFKNKRRPQLIFIKVTRLLTPQRALDIRFRFREQRFTAHGWQERWGLHCTYILSRRRAESAGVPLPRPWSPRQLSI